MEGAMRNRLLGLSLVTLVLFTTATPTAAGDFCIDEGGGSIWVGKNFRLPRPGQCKPWHGFLLTSFSNVSLSTGTGCTASDGTKFRLHLSNIRENVVFEDYIILPLPSLTNGTNDEYITAPPALTGLVTHFTGLQRIPCTPSKVPVP
jgi:hypothetical protein